MIRRTVVIIQARMTSNRLPGKITLPLAGAPLLQRVIERALAIPGADAVCVAAPEGDSHQPIVDMIAPIRDVAVIRGPEDDVLKRYSLAAEATDASRIVRITSDCPMIDPQVSGALIGLAKATGASLARTSPTSGYPWGYDTELFDIELLRAADKKAKDAHDREHVSPYLWNRPEEFPAVFLDRRPDRRSWRVTVDTPKDYNIVRKIFERLYPKNPLFGITEIEALFSADKDIRQQATI